MPAARIAILVAFAMLPAGPAAAAERCVGLDRASCAGTYAGFPEAVAAADAGDTVVVAGAQDGEDAFTDGGKAIGIVGVGGSLLAPLELSGDGSWVAQMRIALPAGAGPALLVDGGVATVDSLDVQLPAGARIGLQASCGTLLARHVTLTGPRTATGAGAACSVGTASIDLRSSALVGATALEAGEHGAVVSQDTFLGDDAQLDDQRQPLSGSPLVDGGDDAPLGPGEPFEDVAQHVRIADGDGDGALRRDQGAYELQPAPVLPAGNVLVNAGAEDGTAHWSGTFTTAAFGDFFYPSVPAGLALGAGARSFAGGSVAAPTAMQRILVADSARAIDAGGAGAKLGALLGGYGADGDTVTVQATYRDPEGRAIAPALTIGPVTAADRANVTTLLRREASGTIPARTRAIDVVITGQRVAGGYTDAYADNLALELSVPGFPVDPPRDPDDPVVPGLKPFAGITVLHPDARLTRAGRVRVALACESRTVTACAGTLELRARLPRAAAPTRIGRITRFDVRPGRRRGVYVKLLASARRALRRRTSIRTTLRAVAADGQGVQRTRTVPLRLRLPRRR